MSPTALALRAVAQFRDVPISELRGQSRARIFAWPRQEACWLMRQRTSLSLPAIGRVLGGRDHTTVLSSVHAVDRRSGSDRVYRRELESLMQLYERMQPVVLPARKQDTVTDRATRLLSSVETRDDPDIARVSAALLSITFVVGSPVLNDSETRASIRSILSGKGVISHV